MSRLIDDTSFISHLHTLQNNEALIIYNAILKHDIKEEKYHKGKYDAYQEAIDFLYNNRTNQRPHVVMQ